LYLLKFVLNNLAFVLLVGDRNSGITSYQMSLGDNALPMGCRAASAGIWIGWPFDECLYHCHSKFHKTI